MPPNRERMRTQIDVEHDERFRLWFGGSRVVDLDGRPLVVHHASQTRFETFEPQPGRDSGFHFGTMEQARMRGGGSAIISAFYLSVTNLKRTRDRGSWDRTQIAAARRAGYDGIVYLNRYEGIPTERIEALAATGDLHRLDDLTDKAFARLVPEARDSYIVFDPRQVKSVNNPGTWDRRDPRFMDSCDPIEEVVQTDPAPFLP